MNDPLIARFAEACGAASPLNLRVDLAEGGVLAEGSVAMPFALVGRADACDVTLADPDVNPRHAWLQVIGGRVWAVDLGSRTGLVWPSGRTGSGWLDVGTPFRAGPFRVHLADAVSRRQRRSDSGINPLLPAADLARTHPSISLEFRNGKRAIDRWAVNRVVTLVGRAPECKIHLNADDISGYHCGLVNTPTGLWVVDLSGRGVVVSGERMRVAPLPHGAELWVGRFLIGCRHENAAATKPPSGSRPGLPDPADAVPPQMNLPSVSETDLIAGITPCLEDEVPLGEVPPRDPDAGMPSSHILTDTASNPTDQYVTGPVSNPIMVSSTAAGAVPPLELPLPPVSPPPAPVPPEAQSQLVLTPVPGLRGLTPGTSELSPADAEALVAPLLRQLGEIHGQMFDQFQQSMLQMLQMFGQMHREQMGAMQQELARIQELNAELGKLQSQVARLTETPTADTPPPSRRLTAHGEAKPPVAVPTGELPAPEAAAAIQDWVLERINTLQQERQSRWQKLVGYFSGGTT